MWKGSVSDCLSHLHDKHGGSQFVAMKNFGQFFPPSRDLWQTALRPDVSGIAVDVRLFHEAGCRMVHKYRVYDAPFPHPVLPEEDDMDVSVEVSYVPFPVLPGLERFSWPSALGGRAVIRLCLTFRRS